MGLRKRLRNAWNAFAGRDPTYRFPDPYSVGSINRNVHLNFERNPVDAIANWIAVDCSSINVQHVLLNEDGRYKETINDSTNKILTRSANIDQTGKELIRDAIYTMLIDGASIIVPTDTDHNPELNDVFEIYQARVGRIIEWRTNHVVTDIYNPLTGQIDQIEVDKKYCAILQNPLYHIMNESNSTGRRLKAVTNKINSLNNKVDSNRFDLLIQLPYDTRSETHKRYAKGRRKELEDDLVDSQFGIGFINANEHVIQLNRSVDNNLWEQYRDLREELYNELGLCKAIFDGSANEQQNLNYTNRTLEPILSTVTEELTRKWIPDSKIDAGEAIKFYRDPFKLAPISQTAEIADKFTRNEIMTSNEMRSVLGMKPSKDPKADMLINSNLNQSDKAIESHDQYPDSGQNSK